MQLDDNVQRELANIAIKHSRRVYDEVGLLYNRLKNWHIKYKTFPTAKSISRIIKNLRIDIKRKETRTRCIKGEVKGPGKNASFVSLDYVPENNNSFSETLSDANASLPNDIEHFNLEEILSNLTDKQRTITQEIVFNDKTALELSKEYNITNIRVYQIRNAAFEKIRTNYEKLSTSNEKPSTFSRVKITPYAERLIKK